MATRSFGSGRSRLVMVGSPPPEKPAYPSDFKRSISAGSSPVFSAISFPALYSRIRAANWARISSATAFFSENRLRISPGSFAEIVEFGSRRIDEVILCILHAPQFAPVEMQPGKKGLSIERTIGLARLAREDWAAGSGPAPAAEPAIPPRPESWASDRPVTPDRPATRAAGLPGKRMISGTCMVAL